MAYNLAILLLACLLVITSLANENTGDLDAFLDDSDLEDHLNFHEARDIDASNRSYRDDLVVVTVTRTVCECDTPTSAEQPPIFSIPETSLASYTIAPSPGTEQPPVSSESVSVPSAEPTPVEPTHGSTGAEPTSAGSTSGDPSSVTLPTQTTTLQTSTTPIDPSTPASNSEAPTGTSSSPSSTAEPPINVGSGSNGGMNNLGLVVALTFALLVGV